MSIIGAGPLQEKCECEPWPVHCVVFLGEALYSTATFRTLVLGSKHEYQTKASFNVNRKVTAVM